MSSLHICVCNYAFYRDEMGLGKTLQCITLIWWVLSHWPMKSLFAWLFLFPPKVLFGWYKLWVGVTVLYKARLLTVVLNNTCILCSWILNNCYSVSDTVQCKVYDLKKKKFLIAFYLVVFYVKNNHRWNAGTPRIYMYAIQTKWARV